MLLVWAGCTSDVSDSGQESELFSARDDQAVRMAEEIGIARLLEQQPNLLAEVGDLTIRRVFIDDLGEAHDRVQQRVNGVPVFGAEGIIHLAPDGTFKGFTDHLLRGIVVDTTPGLVDADAVTLAVEAVGGGHLLAAEPEADLWILRHEGVFHLTYRVRLDLVNGDEPSMPVYFVDAHTGDVVFSYDNLKTGKNRLTYDARKRTSLPGTLRRSEGQGPYGDAVVDEAHDNAGLTYDFYMSSFGRDSYNGAGATIKSTVHYSRNYVNAFWNGAQMVYGDGNGSDSGPLTVLDVVGHELTHAVTDSESDLIYSYESGALNESMSDIFGAWIEAFRDGAVSGDTWKIGEACWTPSIPNDALRYMNDPAIAGDFDYYPTRYTGSSDNGGVHWNSGISNLAFYLMTEGGTHPRGKTSNVVPALHSNAYTSMMMGAAIFYRANTVYLTPSSTFSDARGATAQAATDLYGASAANSVNEAWTAVGVAAPAPVVPWITLSTESNMSGAGASLTYRDYGTPAGAARIKFAISGGSGDADLYVKFGSTPTTTSYDCRPYSAGNNETCTFDPAQSGTYYVMLRGYNAYSGVTLTVSYQ